MNLNQKHFHKRLVKENANRNMISKLGKQSEEI